jgi:hypothetical protein
MSASTSPPPLWPAAAGGRDGDAIVEDDEDIGPRCAAPTMRGATREPFAASAKMNSLRSRLS